MNMKMKSPMLQVAVVFVVVLIGSGLLVYALLRGASSQPSQTRTLPTATPASGERLPNEGPSENASRAATDENQSLISRLFESKSSETALVTEGLGTTLA